ncbi:hypothetical protein Tcan_08027, partial [Toxocara canis]
FVQTPFYTVSASPYVRTRPVALVNDINAGEEQLFASGKPVYMEFGLEFDFTVSSLSRMRFANTANQNAGLDEINLAMIERFHQATDSSQEMPIIHSFVAQDWEERSLEELMEAMNEAIKCNLPNLVLIILNIIVDWHYAEFSSQEMPIIHSFVAQDWEERSLEELMEAMNEAIKCNLPNLVLIILNIIVDWHYAEFRADASDFLVSCRRKPIGSGVVPTGSEMGEVLRRKARKSCAEQMQAIFLCLAVVSLSEVVWCLLGRKWVKCYEGRQGSLVPVTCALPNDRCCSLYFDNKTNAGSCWYELVQVCHEQMQAIFLCLAVVSLSEVVWCLLGRKWVKCYEGRQGSLVPVTCALPNDRCCSLYFDNKTNAGSCWYELVQDSVTAIRRVPMINGVRACCMEDYCNDERHLQKHLQEASQYLEPFSPIDHDGSKITCYAGKSTESGQMKIKKCPLPDDMCCAFYYDNGTNAGMCWHEVVRVSLTGPHRVLAHKATRVCCRPDLCNDRQFIYDNRINISEHGGMYDYEHDDYNFSGVEVKRQYNRAGDDIERKDAIHGIKKSPTNGGQTLRGFVIAMARIIFTLLWCFVPAYWAIFAK